MSWLRLVGALESLEFEIPLESLVVIKSPSCDVAERLVFGLLATEAQRKMAPLLTPTWLPAVGRLATREAGEVLGLRPTFVLRHADAVWPTQTRIGHALGMLSLLERVLGCPEPERCEVCSGDGQRAEVAVTTLVPDPELSIAAGAIEAWNQKNSKFHLGVLSTLASQIGLDVEVPWSALGQAMQATVLYGAPESNYRGVVHDVERRISQAAEGRGGETMASLAKYLVWQECAVCEGTGAGRLARSCAVAGVDLVTLHQTVISRLPTIVDGLCEALPTAHAQRLGEQIAEQVALAEALGLAANTLGSRITELAPAVAQRVRLGEVLGSGLQNALYLLEAPLSGSAGELRASTLKLLQDRVAQGDSIVIVDEHPDASACADAVFVLAVAIETGLPCLAAPGATQQ